LSHGHTVELRLGLVCNQHCGHCSRHTTRRDPRDEGEPLVRLQELLAAGAREVVLTGGEPTLSPLLLTAIRQCVAAGAAAVLETNGLLLAGQAARQRLWDAGLRRVRLHWPAHDAATYAAVTRDEAGFGHAVTALEALLAMGVAVELSVPVLASNVAHIPDMARDPRIAGVRALRFVTWKDEAATGSPHHPLPQLWQAALDGAWQALQADPAAWWRPARLPVAAPRCGAVAGGAQSKTRGLAGRLHGVCAGGAVPRPAARPAAATPGASAACGGVSAGGAPSRGTAPPQPA
jgi:hypothetical protein